MTETRPRQTATSSTDTSSLGGIPGLGGGAPNIFTQLETEAQAGEAAPVLLWIGKNRKTIVTIFVVIIAVIIGYGVWQWQQERATAEAHMALGRILVIDNPAERIKGLEKHLGEAPANLRPGIQMEIAMAAVAAQDFGKAAAAYRAVREALPKSASGILAGLSETALLLQQNKATEAIAVLESMKDIPDFLKNTFAERKAFALEQAGRLEEALAAYEVMLRNTNAPENDYIQYKLNLLKTKLNK